MFFSQPKKIGDRIGFLKILLIFPAWLRQRNDRLRRVINDFTELLGQFDGILVPLPHSAAGKVPGQRVIFLILQTQGTTVQGLGQAHLCGLFLWTVLLAIANFINQAHGLFIEANRFFVPSLLQRLVAPSQSIAQMIFKGSALNLLLENHRLNGFLRSRTDLNGLRTRHGRRG